MAENKEGQSILDLFLPKGLIPVVRLTDSEAVLLYAIWKSAPQGADTFSLPPTIDKKNVMALKTKGYLVGYGEKIELTERGKKVIVEMVTHEPNAFEKNASEMSYNAIKAKKKTRQKQAFKGAEKAEIPPFNLRRESLRRMSGDGDNSGQGKE